MRIRSHEINQRRQRYAKRKKLEKQLAAADNDQARQVLTAKIKKTIPKYSS